MLKELLTVVTKILSRGLGLCRRLWGFLCLKFAPIKSHSQYKKLEKSWGKENLNRVVTILGVLVITLGLRSFYVLVSGAAKGPVKKPISVLVDPIHRADVPVYIKALGTVTAIDSVTVKTQVDGRLIKVLFREGQLVKKGDLLAEIDATPFEAQLKQYEGQLLRDQALLDNAKLDLKRYQTLSKEDSVARQVLDTQIYLVKQYEGAVKTDLGLMEAAKINIGYCKIKTGISGVVGLRQVNEGNYVQTTDTTPITTVNLVNPITVVFPIPEDDLIVLQERLEVEPIMDVEAYDRREEKLLATGSLLAIDSQIDNTTGTIRLKAQVQNEHKRLYPNQFVNIRLKQNTLKDTLTVNSGAVQRGRNGTFVYVVNPEAKTVSTKPVTVKTEVEGIAAIDGDLKEGQVVVIQGAEKLSEGAPVALLEKKHKDHDKSQKTEKPEKPMEKKDSP